MALSTRASSSQPTDGIGTALASAQHVSEWSRFLRRAARSPQGIAGFVIVLLFALMALFGPLVSPYSPTRQQMSKRLAEPSAEFLLGTDDFGRDVLSRILYGAEPSFRVGIFSVALALLAGLALGLVAGYRGGRVDGLTMLAMDVLFAFPAVLLAIAIMALLGPKLENVILAIGVVNRFNDNVKWIRDLVADGDLVTVTSRRGEVSAKAKLTSASPAGLVMMSFHFAESPTNAVTSTHRDPVAKIPELKVAAVRVEKKKAA